jgi:hypothetical protein
MRMNAGVLDLAAARLEELGEEQERLARAELRHQVEEFGFTPPRADKSKRLLGIFYQFTLTVGLTTEVKDSEVKKIAAVCPDALFKRLFKTVTRYKLAAGATMALDPLSKGAPRNLRMMFSKAVETKETAPGCELKRSKRKVSKKKPEKLIPPQDSQHLQ